MANKQKLISLDVLRGIACLLVWLSHLRVGTEYFKASKYDFIQSFSAWGKESVVIFFMLSGIVINLSSQNNDRLAYFKKRFIRIYPIYLAVLVICFTADHYLFQHATDKNILIGNVFLLGTLQAYVCPTAPLNPAVWSIACEAFFYIIFGLIYKPKRLTFIWVWFGICGLSIAYKMYDNTYHTGIFYHILFLLNNSFLWLLGYLVYEYRNRLYTSFPVVICGILMIPMVTRLHKLPENLTEFTYYLEGIYLVPLFIYLLRNYRIEPREKKIFISHAMFVVVYAINLYLLWTYSASLTTNKILYSIVPALSFVTYYKPVTLIIKWVYNRITGIFKYFADISYPVYLLHLPVLYIIYRLMPGQKLVGMFSAVIITLSLSYIFELFLFKKLVPTKKTNE